MPKENPFLNIGFNVLLPVLILSKAQKWVPIELSPALVLLIALSFPFFYGLKDFIRQKKINIFSVIGLVGTALTGGLALLQLKGIYFALKEAGIPLALSAFGVLSVVFKKPIMRWLIIESSLFRKDLIQQKLQENNTQAPFNKLMNQSTIYLSLSFVLSAVLNFIIALWIFKDMDSSLKEPAKAEILNKQIADMTWMGYLFIALPLTVVTVALMAWIVKKLKLLTGLNLEELIQLPAPKRESDRSAAR